MILAERFQNAAVAAFISAGFCIPIVVLELVFSSSSSITAVLDLATAGMTIFLLRRFRAALETPLIPKGMRVDRTSSRVTWMIWAEAITALLSLRGISAGRTTLEAIGVLEDLARLGGGVAMVMLGVELIKAESLPLRRLRTFGILQFPLGATQIFGGLAGFLPDRSRTSEGDAGLVFALLFILALAVLYLVSQVFLGLIFLDVAQGLRDAKAAPADPPNGQGQA